MTQHEELEVAAELERVVRAAIMAAAQVIERQARAQADENRQQVREAALRRLRGENPAGGLDMSNPRAVVEAWRTALHDGVNGNAAAAQRFSELTPHVQRITGLKVHELLADAVADAAASRDDRQGREDIAAIDDVLLTRVQVPPEVEAGEPARDEWERAITRREDVAVEVVREHTPQWFQEGFFVQDVNPNRDDPVGIKEDQGFDAYAALRQFAQTGQMPDEVQHRVWARTRAQQMATMEVGDSPSTMVLPPGPNATAQQYEEFWRATATPEREGGWSTPDPSVAESMPDLPRPEAVTTADEVIERMHEARWAQFDAAVATMDREMPGWFREGSREQGSDELVSARDTLEAMQALRRDGKVPPEQLHRAWARYGSYHPEVVSSAEVPAPDASTQERAVFWQNTAPARQAIEPKPAPAPTKTTATTGRDRGMAPSKAKTPAEREHRRQAWAGAHAEFVGNLPGSPSQEEAKQAWDNAPQGVKFGLYWKHYDADNGTERAAKQPRDNGFSPSKAKTPAERERREQAWKQARADHRAGLAEGTSAQEAAQQWKALDWQDQALYYTNAYENPRTNAAEQQQAEQPQVSRERVVELNAIAADFYRGHLEGSKGGAYMADRLGEDMVRSNDFQLGYAPEGWTNLTAHLRKAGASDEEIVGAGLGRISSRGSVIDAFRDRAMTGVRDREGDVVGFVGRDLSGDERAPKYLNTGSTAAYTKGDHLLGVYEARQGAPVVRVEGPFDALAIHAASGGEVAGVAPLGTALTSTQADQLAQMSNDGRVYLGTDSDRAGVSAAASDFWTLTERDVDVRMVSWPQGEDPAQLLHETPEVLNAYLVTLENSPSAAPVAMSKVLEEQAEGLRAGEIDAFDEVSALEDQVRSRLPEEDAYALSQFVSQRIDEIRGDVEELSADEASGQEREDAFAAEADDARDAGQEQRGEALEGQAKDAEDDVTTARVREASAAGELSAVYDRAQESDLTQINAGREDWTQEARQARAVSARGYTRSTQAMLNEQPAGRATHAKPQVNNLGQGAHHQRLSR